MREASKYLFDTSFEARGNDRATRGDSRPMPTRTEEELQAARAEGLAAGHAAGLADARAQAEHQAAQALTGIARELATLGEAQTETLDRITADAAQLAQQIGLKLARTLVQKYPMTEVEALVKQCLAELHDEPRVVVRASEAIIAEMKDRIDEVTAGTGFPGQVVLLPDDTMRGSDCRIEWADGGMDRNEASLAQMIGDAVDRLLKSKQI
ncbi:MAG TPA: FliH/SctL family protein [Candidatus Cybelea sp.]|nr:FliH/SctL family protein [Candidatus Cybelea sp.]